MRQQTRPGQGAGQSPVPGLQSKPADRAPTRWGYQGESFWGLAQNIR